MFREEIVALVDKALAEFAKFSGLVVGDEEFRGGNSGEFVFEHAKFVELGDGEFSGGVVDAGEAESFPVSADGGEVVRALVVEQRVVIDGAGGEDACDLTRDEFSGDGFRGLFGDCDAFSGFEEAGDVALCGVVGDAAHGSSAAFGEGDVHDGGGGFRVLEEHFIKVAQAVEEDHIRG